MVDSNKCDLSSKTLFIQSAKLTDADSLHNVRRKAWEIAYKDIYTQDEIKNYFNGSANERRTWPSIDYTVEETFVCYIRRKGNKLLSQDDDTDISNHRTGNYLTVKEQKEIEEGEESKLVIGGYAKWCFTSNQKGELLSLYIHPTYWNLGCGSMLWDHIMLRCQEEFISSLDIWVLDKARSKDFYISKGCHQSVEQHKGKSGKSGDYFIGQHQEKALCYEKKFTK